MLRPSKVLPGRNWKKGGQVKRTGVHPIKNKVDSIDDKIRLASRIVEAPTTVGPPSKILRFPAWRPIHWIRPFDRMNFCLFTYFYPISVVRDNY